MLSVFLASFAALIPITNPLGAVAAFAALTSSMDRSIVRRQAWLTGLYVCGILVVFSVAGTLILTFFGIGLPALQVAGGIVVVYSGFTMLAASPQLSSPERNDATAKQDVSFSPMALPLVAGPGAIGVVIALSARNPGVDGVAGVAIAGVAIAAVVAFLLRFGTPVVRKLGAAGLGAITRVMGFLILAIGVEIGLHGVVSFVSS